MAKIYADLCEAGLRTVLDIEDIIPVPTFYKDATIKELIARKRFDLVP